MDAPNPPGSPGGAPLPEGWRRVAIDPLSRVEGHGKVTLLLDEQRRVQQARLHIVEFRGFEKFIEGRPYWEVPVVVQRLCGICPVSHHLAASKAIDAALGVVAPPAAQAMRALMHHGQILQSHALHFFHLASPDLLYGFESDAARRNVAGLAADFPDVLRQGVALRRFGQEVVRLTAGKRVHGTGSIPGGMNRRITPDERAALQAELPAVIAACEDAVTLTERLREADPAAHDGFAAFPSKWLAQVASDGALALYDGRLRWCEPDGRVIGDQVAPADYLQWIEESVRPWTYMKFPSLRAQGPAAGWYRVGPLARLQACSRLTTPRAEERRRAFLAHGPAALQSSLAYHGARMIEMLHAAELIERMLADAASFDGPLTAPLPAPADRPGEGVGILEAPRGTLIHHYRIGADDLVTMCNLIVSTTHNNQAMHEAVAAAARAAFDGREVTEGLLNRVEVAVRAYDPCLSCATHALGQMPLTLQLEGPGGEPLGGGARDGDGSRRRWSADDGPGAAPALWDAVR